MKNPVFKRVIILVLVLAIIVGVIFFIRSCSAPPEYSEIEARFKELIKNSEQLNVILFGDGLECYPRIYNHTMKIHTDVESGDKYYYYEIEDEQYGTVYAYSGKVGSTKVEDVRYLAAFDAKKEDAEPVYEDAEAGVYYYYIEYSEPEVEFYYSSTDPDNYSYVKDDALCVSVSQIKEMAQKVYSKDYLRSLYEPLFDGFEAVPARFWEHGSNGRLMQYDNYEPFFSETCVYMFETAQIDTWQSNSRLVRINIKAYLPSDPDTKYDVTVDLALQDGEWYLETPTYIAGE